MEVQLQAARHKVQQFMQKTGGDIPLWGQAKRFLFYVRSDFAYVLDVHGCIIGTRTAGVPNQAILGVKCMMQ